MKNSDIENKENETIAGKVTLKDIGVAAGVSTVTASKALSGKSGVSEAKRQEILQIAKELGYHKLSAEKEPAKKLTIGILVADRYLQNLQSFYWMFYQQITQRAVVKGYYSVLEMVSEAQEKRCAKPRMVAEEKVDSIIAIGNFRKSYEKMLHELEEVPIVYLDTMVMKPGYDCVVSANLYGGYAMTSLLLKMGHRKIGYVGTLRVTDSIDDRYLGYYKALMENEVEANPEWLVADRDTQTLMVDESGHFEIPFWDMPTAFVCNSDLTASILIKRLAQMGLRVPEDISVVGFDNFLPGAGASEITTYETDVKEMITRAVHIAAQKAMNPNYHVGTVTIAGKVIERATTAKPNEID